MTETKNIGMLAHNGSEIPDYATRVYHNMATSLPLFSILYPSIRRYTVQGTGKSETPVDCQSYKRKGGLFHNLLRPVKRLIQTPFITGLFEALSFALYSLSFSIFIPKMVKSEGKKSDNVQVLSIETGVVNTSSVISDPLPMSSSSITKKESVREPDGTPPPSRPPSPPPSPTSSVSHQDSEWSIEIQELSDEPPPAIQPAKDKGSKRDRRRSSSWSRSLMNSFRRKKNKESKTEVLYKTAPLPDDLSNSSGNEEDDEDDVDDNNDDNNDKDKDKEQERRERDHVNIEETNSPEEIERVEETGDQEDEIEVEETAEEKLASELLAAEAKANQSSQPKNRLSRMLSFGTFGRRKSILVEDEMKSDRLESENKENTTIKIESKQGKKRELKSDVKSAKGTKGKSHEVDGENVGLSQPTGGTKSNKIKVKTSKEKKSKKTLKEKSVTNTEADEMDGRKTLEVNSSSTVENPVGQEVSNKTKSLDRTRSNQRYNMFTFKSLSKSVDHSKSDPAPDAEEFVEQETGSTSDGITRSELNATKSKRRSIANFFKREKNNKIDENQMESAESIAVNLKKGGRFGSSFGRRSKAKSIEVETTKTTEEAVAVPVERNKKPRRSTSVVFGSSFSLKKMFLSDPSAESSEQISVHKTSGILTKRSKAPQLPVRPKSVHIDSKLDQLENVPASGASELRSSRGTLSERFISFTRESFRIKKRPRSISIDEATATATDQTGKQPIEVEFEDKETIINADVHDDAVDDMPADVDNTNVTAHPLEGELESTHLTHITKTKTSSSVNTSTLHDEDSEPKHVVVSSSPPASREVQPNSDLPSGLVVNNTSNADQASLQELEENPVPEPHKVKTSVVPANPANETLLVDALGEILGQLRSSSSVEGARLKDILQNPHLEALLETHDAIKGILGADQLSPTSGEFGKFPYDPYSSIEWEMPADISAVRVVGLRKNPGEPLGLTVKTEEGQLVIARILAGGAVDRQGLLHVGDIIGEVNNVVVRSAEQLQVEIARCREHIQLKILPSAQENGSNGAQVGQSPSTILASETLNSASVCCVRAHFDYEPKDDKLLPCPEIGLGFKKGDILQVVNQSDPNWWQAKKVGWSGPAGLIPSQELEERRKAFVAPEADFVHKIGFCGTRISKKKKKLMYQIKSSIDLDKAELLLYEEVTRMPPFRRKTLVLVGSEGIGRRTLKNRLINSDPDRFGTTMPHTSRPMRELEEDGMGYWFVSREEMEHDVRDHQFLEFGEHNSHLYGTKLDSIRAVIRQGKMCVLDCSPNALKILHNSPEFMPYVIFLAAPGMEQLKSIYENSRYSSRNLGTFDRSSSIRFSSRRARTLESLTSLYEEEDFKNALEESARIQRIYEKYFDQIIVNEDPDQTFRKVVEALEILSNQHQWVPVSWVY